MNSVVYPDRQTWLASRQYHIGASEIPCILGISKYKSAFSLWHEKKGLIPAQEASIPARVGLALEPLLTEFYEEGTGAKVVDPGPYTVYYHPECHWMGCTPDRVIIENDRIIKAVELKTIGEMAAAQLRDGEPPIAYQVQLQAQMAVLGCDQGDLACLIGNRKFEVFPFERHEKLIENILRKCWEFWELLQGDVPPEIDGSYSTAATLKALHPDDSGETKEASDEVVDAAIRVQFIKREIAKLEAEKLECENVIKAEIGGNTYLDSELMTIAYKTQERKGYLKIDAAKEGALIDAGIDYTTVSDSKFRVLRMKAKQKGDDE